jgi:chromosome segregation ATPase
MQDRVILFWNKWNQRLSDLKCRVLPGSTGEENASVLDTRKRVVEKGYVEGIKSDIGRLKLSLDEKNLANEALRKENNDKTREIRKLKAKIKKHIADAENQKNRHKVQSENVAVLIKNLGDHLSETEKEKSVSEKERFKQKLKQEEMKREIQFLKLDMRQKEKELEGVAGSNKKYEEAIKDKEKEISILFMRLKHLEEERKQLVDEIRVQKLNAILKAELKNSKNRNSIINKVLSWMGKPMVDIEIGK